MSNKKQNRKPGFHIYSNQRLYGSSGKWFYWVFYSKNGQVLANSENYKSKQGAAKSIMSILNLLDAQDLCLYYDHTKTKTRFDEPNLIVIR